MCLIFLFVKEMKYDIIGNLDADLSFDSDYFAFLLDKFIWDPKLGVAGTPFVEDGRQTYDYRFTNIEHVSGQISIVPTYLDHDGIHALGRFLVIALCITHVELSGSGIAIS